MIILHGLIEIERAEKRLLPLIMVSRHRIAPTLVRSKTMESVLVGAFKKSFASLSARRRHFHTLCCACHPQQ